MDKNILVIGLRKLGIYIIKFTMPYSIKDTKIIINKINNKINKISSKDTEIIKKGFFPFLVEIFF